MNVTPPTAATRSQTISRAREYETIYILRSDVDADTAEKVQARVADAVDREQGKLVKVEAWGRRKLAYPVGKQRKGVYVYVKFVGGGGLVAEVERNLKLQESVMKYMTVQSSPHIDLAALQIDPEETKLGKLELPTEPEPEESREKQLGLIDFGGDAPHRRPMDEAEEFAEPAEEPAEEAGADKTDKADKAAKPAAEGGEEG